MLISDLPGKVVTKKDLSVKVIRVLNPGVIQKKILKGMMKAEVHSKVKGHFQVTEKKDLQIELDSGKELIRVKKVASTSSATQSKNLIIQVMRIRKRNEVMREILQKESHSEETMIRKMVGKRDRHTNENLFQNDLTIEK